MARVVLLGTLDTKEAEYRFLREKILAAGHDVVVIDAGITPYVSGIADYDSTFVARAAGHDVAALASAGDRGAAVNAMAEGAAAVVLDLLSGQGFDGICALGGSGGSALATHAMRTLPIGVPKLMVSTVASGDIGPYVGTCDLTMMHSVVDIAGLNRISARILENAAGAISGMAAAYAARDRQASHRPVVAATMFGVTTKGVMAAKEWLEERGYEVLVFHAVGTGGRAMEALAADGYLDGILDLTTTELADELVGGIFSAGPDRLRVAARHAVPQVVSVGALDMVNFGPRDTIPAKFAGRRLHKHNASITLMRTTPAECAALGGIIGERLASGISPTRVFLPLRGISAVAVPGGIFHDAEADTALFTSLRSALPTHIEITQLDTDINDPAFATAAAAALDELITKAGRPRRASAG
ncbi:hypothetical protein VE25_07595 [Devosia geojensis]|uniref:Uncharacterized protein n=1 Tax=Devosia geojensis TaxID=443610 RepID=A0A0F5FV03_9HYPH|nr:Tm-1-like ATP-binding domain-containing protein [Devosia geojensis]KKB12405.1 hypothetical protein VE25_07595 [Devosia geojensis]